MLRYFIDVNFGEFAEPKDKISSLSKALDHVRAFIAAFKFDQDVALYIVCPSQNALYQDLVDEVKALCKMEKNFLGDMPFVDVLSSRGELDCDETDVLIDLDPSLFYSVDTFLENYLTEAPADRSGYDVLETANAYDADVIRLAQRHKVALTRSTSPKGYQGLFSYLENPETPNIHSFLDVGCGAGMFYSLLRESRLKAGRKMPLYVGIDFSKSQIARARQKYPDALFKVGSAISLDFDDDSFDVVCANSVLNFIDTALIPTALGEMIRVARRGVDVMLYCVDEHARFPGPERRQAFSASGNIVEGHYPDLPSILDVLEKSGYTDFEVTDALFSENEDATRYSAISHDQPEFTYMTLVLDNIIQMVDQANGDPDEYDADVKKMMRRGCTLNLANNQQVAIPPGFAWTQYKQVRLRVG